MRVAQRLAKGLAVKQKEEPNQPNYCPDCGDSLRPLDVPHVKRVCPDCGKTKHVVERGEKGGIHIRAGDRFVIPAGWFSMSLSPASRTKLTRSGIKLFLRAILFSPTPEASAIVDTLRRYTEVSEDITHKSSLLADYDLDSPDGAESAWNELATNHSDSREWYAALCGAFAQEAIEALEIGDSERAASATHLATASHAMTQVLHEDFESALWNGYQASRVIYEAAVASLVPAEKEALERLQPLFSGLDEATLHVWVESGEPIGPRIGVSQVSEPVLRAFARYHLAQFERRREDVTSVKSDSRFSREMRVKWASAGVLIGGVLVAILNLILNRS